MSQSLHEQFMFFPVPRKISTSYHNMRLTPEYFFHVWEVVDGMCVSPMTSALDSCKAVWVQSGLSQAWANPPKEKR